MGAGDLGLERSRKRKIMQHAPGYRGGQVRISVTCRSAGVFRLRIPAEMQDTSEAQYRIIMLFRDAAGSRVQRPAAEARPL